MAVKLKDFVISLARKAGFDTESDAAKPFFAALPETDVPDDVKNGIDNSLISLTDAKNNHPDIKNYYQKQSLDGIDKKINELLAEFEVDDTVKQEILGERSTYQRVPLLTKKIVELQIAKANAKGGTDKTAIQKQIDQLHADIAAEKKGRADEKKAYDDQLTGFKINTRIGTLVGAHKTIHDELDPEIKGTVINTIISKALQEGGAKFAFDENGGFVLLKNDGTNYYGENHQQVTPAQFIEQTLAKNKQLKVTPTNGSNGANNSQNRSQGSGNNGNNGSDTNHNAAVIDLNAQALKDFEKSSAAAV